jgi:hypothetical protein
MLAFVYRLIRQFELEHGIRPNLLYLNHFHAENLKASFDHAYCLSQVVDILGMELIIENDLMHPHVAWTQVAEKVSSF